MLGGTHDTSAKKQEETAFVFDPDKPLDLVVLGVKQDAARCRTIDTQVEVNLRSEGLWHLIPGEITTVRPKKSWRFKGYTYLAAAIESSRLDIAALGLVPLRIEPMDVWDPQQEYWGEPDDPLEPWAAQLVAEGSRPCFEMEQVIPGFTLEELVDDDPIVEASERAAGGDHRGARRILAELLMLDLRWLDAHAHLGNFLIDHWP